MRTKKTTARLEFESTAPTTSRLEFMQRRFDWKPILALKLPKVEWIGSDLFLTLDADRCVVVSLVTAGHAEHYWTLLARVVNKRDGEVDRKGFSFGEHLRGVPRVDGRKDDPSVAKQDYEVISYVKWDWYIAVPKTTTPLTEALAAYVATFV